VPGSPWPPQDRARRGHLEAVPGLPEVEETGELDPEVGTNFSVGAALAERRPGDIAVGVDAPRRTVELQSLRGCVRKRRLLGGAEEVALAKRIERGDLVAEQ